MTMTERDIITEVRTMKAIKCELCGSGDLIKQDGLFVCQNCGTKYSVEEARKLMIEGTVDVSGSTVKIDSTDELKNLYTLARRARGEHDTEHQWKYYEMILRKDPDSWEAYLYYRISQLFETAVWNGNALIESATTVLGLIWDGTKNEAEATNAVQQVSNIYTHNCLTKFDCLEQILAGKLMNADNSQKKLCREIYYNDVKGVENILLKLGDTVMLGFENVETIQPIIAGIWKTAIDIDGRALPNMTKADKNREEDCKMLSRYTFKIRKIDPSYEVPQEKKKGLGALFSKSRR